MTTTVDKINMKRKYGLDRRVKFTLWEKQQVKKMWNDGNGWSMRAIARYGILTKEGVRKPINRSTVKIIIDPARAIQIIEWAKQHKIWVRYNRKEIHGPAARKHRDWKRKLLSEGKIKPA